MHRSLSENTLIVDYKAIREELLYCVLMQDLVGNICGMFCVNIAYMVPNLMVNKRCNGLGNGLYWARFFLF